MRIEDNTIIQSLKDENVDIKQGAVIYLLTESFSILHHINEIDAQSEECKMLTEDLVELFETTKEYCKKYQIDWEECKRRITENKQNSEFNAFIRALKL